MMKSIGKVIDIGYFWKGKSESLKEALAAYESSPYAFHKKKIDATDEFRANKELGIILKRQHYIKLC